MLENISLQYPSWYILICLLLGLLYAGVLYYKDKRFAEYATYVPILMSILRFLSVTGIALLLLNPLLKRFTQETKKPIIVFAEDISSSLSFKNDSTKRISSSSISTLKNSLSDKYEVKHVKFGEEVLISQADSLVEGATNISGLFKHLSDNYSDDNVGAIILATDGIYNQGNNPIYTPLNLSVPIYTIAEGDTTQRRDLIIKNIYNNKIAYLGNDFVTQVDIQAFNATGQKSKLEVYKISKQSARKKIMEKVIHIDKHDFFKTIDLQLKADQNGLNQYRVVLKSIKDELTLQNNSKDIFVEVLDLKQKILIVADAPHPDISAIRTTLTENENYQIDLQLISDEKQKNLNSYDLVIFHNLPSNGHNLTTEIAELNRRRTPRLFIAGTSINHSQFNKVQNCIQTKANNVSISEVQAKVNPNFRSFIIDNNMKNQLGKFPPLVNGFGDYSLSSGSNALLNQKISKIETKYPLLAYKDIQGIKTGVLVGEGIWKWKYFDFVENSNNEILNQLLRKTFQYLTVKNDKRKLRVETSKKLYKENESIQFSGQLFNDSYTPINDPELNIEIKDTNGKSYEYAFSRVDDYYVLDTKQLPAGSYQYIASCMLDGKRLEQKSRFSIKSIQVELYDLTARHDILKQLSNQSKGQFFTVNQSNEVPTAIINNTTIKPIVYQHEKSESIINYKWILGLLILLLVIEWFLRRYFGSY